MKSIYLRLLNLFFLLCITGYSQDEYTALFNGVDLTGWEANFQPESFTVADSIITTQSSSERAAHLFYVGEGGILAESAPNAKFKDFELVIVSRGEPKSNSGIFFHTDDSLRDVDKGFLYTGYELQLNNTTKEATKTGSLYSIVNLKRCPIEDTQWFETKIRVEGKRIQVWLNESQVVDYTEPEDPVRDAMRKGRLLNPEGGLIAFQAHDKTSIWHFKEIKIKDLSNTISITSPNGGDTLTAPHGGISPMKFSIQNRVLHLPGQMKKGQVVLYSLPGNQVKLEALANNYFKIPQEASEGVYFLKMDNRATPVILRP